MVEKTVTLTRYGILVVDFVEKEDFTLIDPT